MKEQFYVDLRRREEAQAKLSVRPSEPVVPTEDKLISRFEPRDFPERACRPVVRRRSLKSVWELITK